jgi:hypothetical protein
LITAYIKRCFANERTRFDDTLDRSMLAFIKNDEFDESIVDDMLNEFENPAKILDTNWYAIKPMYEKKYREIYRHRISKTQMISLND